MMKKKSIIIPIITLALIAGGFFYWHFTASQNALSNKEREDAYKQLLGRDLKQEKTIQELEFKGKFFSLKYPSTLTIKESTSSANPPSEVLRMLGFDPRINLAITVNDAVNASLEENSAVKFRNLNKEYVSEKTTIKNVPAQVFTKSEGDKEKTIIFKDKNLFFSISVTGANEIEMDKLFNSLKESFIVPK